MIDGWHILPVSRSMALLAGLTCSGCMILPLPSTTDVAPGVNGTVRDSKTGHPIAGAEITSRRNRFSSRRRSDAQGNFKIWSLYQFHFVTAWTVASGSAGMLPSQWSDVPHSEKDPLLVTATAPGFPPATTTIAEPYHSHSSPDGSWTVNFTLHPTSP